VSHGFRLRYDAAFDNPHGYRLVLVDDRAALESYEAAGGVSSRLVPAVCPLHWWVLVRGCCVACEGRA